MFPGVAPAVPQWLLQPGLIPFYGIDEMCVKMARINLRLYGRKGYRAQLTVGRAELAMLLRGKNGLPALPAVVKEIPLVEVPPELIRVYGNDDYGQMGLFSRLQIG